MKRKHQTAMKHKFRTSEKFLIMIGIILLIGLLTYHAVSLLNESTHATMAANIEVAVYRDCSLDLNIEQESIYFDGLPVWSTDVYLANASSLRVTCLVPVSEIEWQCNCKPTGN